ncbi:Biopolymer transport protein ExbD/TolR [hydrothermal vent metagenome]|uniref:Biopolymer transport protein ExbD/TolR n=1 Tax=hydrothermal vent metagenome TaxID=652676 RepID=A0A3B1D828_9ZZZZ
MVFEGRSRIRTQLDMAPLIDVVFLLLIFFMLTSTFFVPEAIDLSLPQSKSAVVSDSPSITLTLDHLGVLNLNGDRVALKDLRVALAPLLKTDGSLAVALKSDARTAVQQLIEVMDEVRAAGGNNIALFTTPAVP